MIFTIMTPKGMRGPSYEAETSELAIAMAEKDGFDDIVDVQDQYLVVRDDPND